MMNNKAFTLIELIVVIAILGVLVLLAAPKFLGYTEDAKVVQIKNDVKVVEIALGIELIEDPDFISNKGWESISLETMNSYVGEGSLFDTKGVVSEELGGEFYVVEDKLAKTKLNGQFITNEGGKIYYYEYGFSVGGNDGVVSEYIPEGYVLAKSGDFEWVELNYGYEAINEEELGYYNYVGNDEYVVIPHKINGNPMTSYYRMFLNSNVKGVASDNQNVTNMNSALTGIKDSTTLDVTYLDTSNVENMGSMFSEYYYGSSVTEIIGLESLDTSNVTNMFRMFEDSLVTELDLSSFDTSNVMNMSQMFNDSQAESIIFGDNFDTSSVTNMSSMFRDSQATSLDLSSFDTSKVTNMSYMFRGSQATSIIFGDDFDTSNVTNMSWMFRDSQAETLDLSSFNTSKVTNMNRMFYNSHTTTLDLSSFDTSNVTNMDSMFENSKATTGYAQTQEDADKFNAVPWKPSKLTFIIKP